MKIHLPEEGYKRNIVLIVYALFGIILIFIALKLIRAFLLPFVLAFFVCILIEPMAKYVHQKTKIPEKVLSVIMFLLFIFLFALFSVFLSVRIYSEVKGLILRLGERSDDISAWADSVITKIKEKFNISEENGYIGKTLENVLQNSISMISSKAADYTADFFTHLPSLFISVITFIFASVYISKDGKKINEYFSSFVSERTGRHFANVKTRIVRYVYMYSRAYFILFLITFAELYFAFIVIKADYALAIAFITALLDILPAIGVGSVLIPWSVYSFVAGNIKRGISLLVIYGIISLIRQIAEPRIVGANLGIHPLAALVSVYVGFKAAGVIGLFISPIAASVIKEIAEYYRNMKKDTGC